MVMATMVPMKGASIEFPVKRCLSFLKEIGLENADVVLNSDQEKNSIMDVLNSVAKRRSANSKLELLEGRGILSAGPQGRSIPEASPVGSSGSNGVIERAVQAIEGQARTIKLALESRIGAEIPSGHGPRSSTRAKSVLMGKRPMRDLKEGLLIYRALSLEKFPVEEHDHSRRKAE